MPSKAWEEFAATQRGEACDLPGLWSAGVVDALTRVLAAGALVSSGMSRDGGALGVTVTHDGEFVRQWFREPDGLETWLNSAADVIASEAASPASTARRKR